MEQKLQTEVFMLKLIIGLMVIAFTAVSFMDHNETNSMEGDRYPLAKISLAEAQTYTDNYREAYPDQACAVAIPKELIVYAYNEVSVTANQIEGVRAYFGMTNTGDERVLIVRSLNAEGDELQRDPTYRYSAYYFPKSDGTYGSPCPTLCDKSAEARNECAFD